MSKIQIVRCPNCGSCANRHFVNDEQSTNNRYSTQEIIRTECSTCDYLMVMRSVDGSVIEAYAPGISIGLSQRLVVKSSVESAEVTDISTRFARSSVKKTAA